MLLCPTFWPSGSHAMTIILTTTDDPYPTTNSPPLTTHYALNACEALRHLSLCKARVGRQVSWEPGLFSGKQLTAGMFLKLRK